MSLWLYYSLCRLGVCIITEAEICGHLIFTPQGVCHAHVSAYTYNYMRTHTNAYTGINSHPLGSHSQTASSPPFYIHTVWLHKTTIIYSPPPHRSKQICTAQIIPSAYLQAVSHQPVSQACSLCRDLPENDGLLDDLDLPRCAFPLTLTP